MQIVCAKDNLGRALSAVQRAVSSRGLLPILSNVLLSVKDQSIYLVATDLEIGIRTRLDGEVKGVGDITLPARPLSDLVSKLPSADIEVSYDEGEAQTKLLCGRSRYSLFSLPATDFPTLPEAGDAEVLQAAPVLQAIRQTVFATSTDAAKSVLGGVRFQLTGGFLELAATDGYRLAVRRIPVESQADVSMTLPARILSELVRLAGGEESLALSKVGQQVVFSFGDKLLSSRLLEGQYPDYRKIIPQAFERQAVLPRAEFLAAVERAAVLASDRTNILRLRFGPGELVIQADTPDVGQASEVMECQLKGDALEINFNAKYLADALRHLEGDVVQFDLGGSINPALLRTVGDDDYLCMLMPIRP